MSTTNNRVLLGDDEKTVRHHTEQRGVDRTSFERNPCFATVKLSPTDSLDALVFNISSGGAGLMVMGSHQFELNANILLSIKGLLVRGVIVNFRPMPNNFVRVGIRWQEKYDFFEQLFNEQESCAIGVGNTDDDQVFLEQTFDGEECRIEATMRQLEELFAVLLSPDSREGPEKIIADSIENEIRIQLFPVGMSFRIRQGQNRILGVGDIRSLFRLSRNQSKRKSW